MLGTGTSGLSCRCAYSAKRCESMVSPRNGRIRMEGKVYGRLTVLSPITGSIPLKYRCVCECGTYCDKVGQKLRRGETKSCGCLAAELLENHRNKSNAKWLGKRQGKLLIVSRADKPDTYTGTGKHQWFLTRCDCGVEKVINKRALKDGAKSCGCSNPSVAVKRVSAAGVIIEGDDHIVRECTSCNKPFSVLKGGTRTSTLCRCCKNRHNRVVTALRRKNPLPDNHRCECCGRSEEELPVFKTQNGSSITPFHLDHCHTTDKFRGYLCANCNKGLGCFQDDTEALERAVEYLKRTSGMQ